MSKQEYKPPTGQPAGWSENQQGGYSASAVPAYNSQTQERGWGGHSQQQGYPQQGYQQGYQQQGYPQQGYQQGYPQQGGYYNQQQPQYTVQQQRPSGGGGGCLTGCLAALCVCCTLDMLF